MTYPPNGFAYCADVKEFVQELGHVKTAQFDFEIGGQISNPHTY